MDPTIAPVSPESWMSLWLAKVRAWLDVLLCQATGVDDAEARVIHAAVAAELERARPHAGEVPASWLCTRLSLSATEEHVIWLLIACELSEAVRGQLLALGGGRDLDPTISLVQRVVHGAEPSLAAWRELGPEGALTRLALVVRTDAGDARAPAYRQGVTVTPRVRGLALGDPGLAAELASFARIVTTPRPVGEVVTSAGVRERVCAQLRQPRAFVLLTGKPGMGRATLLRAAASAAGQRVLDVDARALARGSSELAHQLRVVAREAQLLGCTVLVRHLDALGGGADDAEERLGVLDTALFAATSAPIVATASVRPSQLRGARPMVTVELGALTGAQRAALWRRAIPGLCDTDAEHLATYYPLAPAVIHAAGEALGARVVDQVTEDVLRETIFSVVDDRLAGRATRVTVTQTWDDLVLPPDQHEANHRRPPVVGRQPRVRGQRQAGTRARGQRARLAAGGCARLTARRRLSPRLRPSWSARVR